MSTRWVTWNEAWSYRKVSTLIIWYFIHKLQIILQHLSRESHWSRRVSNFLSKWTDANWKSVHIVERSGESPSSYSLSYAVERCLANADGRKDGCMPVYSISSSERGMSLSSPVSLHGRCDGSSPFSPNKKRETEKNQRISLSRTEIRALCRFTSDLIAQLRLKRLATCSPCAQVEPHRPPCHAVEKWLTFDAEVACN